MKHILLIIALLFAFPGMGQILKGPFIHSAEPSAPTHDAKCGDDWRTSSHPVDKALLRAEQLDEQDSSTDGPHAIGGDSIRSLGEALWKRQMLKEFARLKSKMPASKQPLLDKAQQAWSRYAEAQLEVRYFLLDPKGEMMPSMALTPLAQARRCRAIELQDAYAELMRQ